MQIELTQGDVTLTPVSEIPSEAIKLEGTVLQPSETHGKFHRFATNAKVQVYAMPNELRTKDTNSNTLSPDDNKYVEVFENTFLYHGKDFEHSPEKNREGDHFSIPVPAGKYQVGITSEYDYESMMARPVVD